MTSGGRGPPLRRGLGRHSRLLFALLALQVDFPGMADLWRKPRNLLPLPRLDPGPGARADACRDVRRRTARRLRWQDWAAQGIDVLNGLGHEGGPVVDGPPVASAAQTSCLDRLTRAYKSMPLEVDDVSFGVGALRELCAKSPCYAGERDDIQPYSPERVSWPPSDFKPVGLEKLLAPEDVKLVGS